MGPTAASIAFTGYPPENPAVAPLYPAQARGKELLIEELVEKAFPRPAFVRPSSLEPAAKAKQQQALREWHTERTQLRAHLHAHLEPLPPAPLVESEESEEEQPLFSKRANSECLRAHLGVFCSRPLHGRCALG